MQQHLAEKISHLIVCVAISNLIIVNVSNNMQWNDYEG